MAQPKLVYFATRGRAEVIRLACAEAGLQYEEENFDPKEGFAALEASGRLPFQAVPVWEEEGLRLAQSYAILNHVGRTHGLRGNNAREEALIDQALGAVEDVRTELRRLIAAPPEKRPEVRKELLETTLPKWFGMLEKLLGANAFVLGDRITVADLALWYLIEMAKDNGFGASLSACPKLQAFFERVAARPKIAAYQKSPRRHGLTKLP